MKNSRNKIEVNPSLRSRTWHPLEGPRPDNSANYHEFGISAACCALMQYNKQFTRVRVKSQKAFLGDLERFFVIFRTDRNEWRAIVIYAIISR